MEAGTSAAPTSTPPPEPGRGAGRPRRTRVLLLLLLALQALWLLGALFPAAVDGLYGAYIFPPLVGALALLSATLPHSCAELGALALLGWLLLCALRGVRSWRAEAGERRALLVGGVLRLARLACVLYAWFLLAWGFHYVGPTAYERLELERPEVTVEELRSLAQELVADLLELEPQVPRGAGGVMRPVEAARLRELVTQAFALAAEREPRLAGPAPNLREPWISPLMTAAGISGIYSPFTAEPHINAQLVACEAPFVACHEVSHLRGIAREDEANYMATLVCRLAPDARLRYSGSLLALGYVIRGLVLAGDSEARSIYEQLGPGVEADLEARRAFWSSGSRLVALTRRVANRTNDTYLRLQGEGRGVRSYGEVLQLLVAERRARLAGRRGGD